MNIVNFLFCAYEFDLGNGLSLVFLFFRPEVFVAMLFFAAFATIFYIVARDD